MDITINNKKYSLSIRIARDVLALGEFATTGDDGVKNVLVLIQAIYDSLCVSYKSISWLRIFTKLKYLKLKFLSTTYLLNNLTLNEVLFYYKKLTELELSDSEKKTLK